MTIEDPYIAKGVLPTARNAE